MKAPSAILLLASSCLLANLHADLTIVQRFEGLGQNMESTTKIKPGKTRVDALPANCIIMDTKTGSLISLIPAEKKYVKIPSQMAQAVLDSVKKTGDQPAAPPALTPTGKKDTISGFACEEYTCTVRGSKLTLWLTTALPDYEAVLHEMTSAFNEGPMSGMMKSLGMDLATLPGFPVRTTSEPKPGQAITSTILSVSTKPIPDTDFDVPAGYTEMKMPSLTPPAAEQAPAVSK